VNAGSNSPFSARVAGLLTARLRGTPGAASPADRERVARDGACATDDPRLTAAGGPPLPASGEAAADQLHLDHAVTGARLGDPELTAGERAGPGAAGAPVRDDQAGLPGAHVHDRTNSNLRRRAHPVSRSRTADEHLPMHRNQIDRLSQRGRRNTWH
jgi:hypothetical protein